MEAGHQDHFALAPTPTFRNLFIMRACFKQFLFLIALAAAFAFTRSADAQALATNDLRLAKAGILQALTPPDWTGKFMGVHQPDQEPIFDFYAPNHALMLRLYVRWDGFGGKPIRPGETEMSKIVSNTVATQYLPVAVEKSFNLEKLRGPAVTGIYARITDTNWTPVLKNTNDYPNICEGMFRTANIWGNFNLLTHDKDGPEFKAGLQVLESLRRKPSSP